MTRAHQSDPTDEGRRLARAALATAATLFAAWAVTPARGQVPATRPAKMATTALSTPAAVDTNSPKAAVKSFVAAEIKGDGPAIRRVLLATTPTEQQMAGAISDLAVAIADLDRAMVAKFGAGPTEQLMGDKDAVLADVMSKLDKSTAAVTGDTAIVTSAADATPPGTAKTTGSADPATQQDTMTLRRVDGQWKVSVADMAKGSTPENVKRTLDSVGTAVAGYRSVMADLTAGKLADVDAVAAALNAKLTPPNGDPAAAPGTPPGPKPVGN